MKQIHQSSLPKKRVYVYKDNKQLVVIMLNGSSPVYAYLDDNPEYSFFEPAYDETVLRAQQENWKRSSATLDINDWRDLRKGYGEGIAVHDMLGRIVRLLS